VALKIACPNCGVRPFTEFWCAGEVSAEPDAGHHGLRDDFERVWMRANVAGVQEERWFHHAGCRRWMTVTRDTRTNEIHGVA
jgi:sarcosine oxidase subunit delta